VGPWYCRSGRLGGSEVRNRKIGTLGIVLALIANC
jgi:hypothetical protein